MSQIRPYVGRLKANFVAEGGRLGTPKTRTAAGSQAARVGPPLWASALVYVLLSVLMTWPLTKQLGTHFPSPDTDIFNAYWSNWWFRHALGSGQNPYVTDYLLYPVGFDVVSFGFSPFLALLWLPLNWFLPDLAAFNLVFLVTIVLSCLAMDQLVRYLTGNAWAALVAGITFGFAPSLVAERLPHVSKAALFWIPWALLVLTRLVREARMRDAFLLAALVGLAFLTLPQVGIFVVMSCAVYFAGLALVERKQWHKLAVRRLLLAGLLSMLVLAPVFVYAWQSLLQPEEAYLLEWGADLAQTDLLAYVVPPHQHPLLGALQAVVDGRRFVLEGQYWAYLGLVPVLLALYGVISRPRAALPWLLMGSVFFVLALGPYLRLGGEVYPAVKLPYSLATGLFSAAGLNTPNRFNMCMAAALSVLVGLACAQLHVRFERAWLLAVAGLLILGEYLVAPLPTVLPPASSAFYEQMAADGEDYAIVDLPLTRPAGEIHRYYQTIHQKPIVGGWVKRVPASAFDFVRGNSLLAPWIADDESAPAVGLDSALDQLSEANVRYIVVHKDQLPTVPESMRILLSSVRPVHQDSQIRVLPVDSSWADVGYYVADWLGEAIGLIAPTAFLQSPEPGEAPVLSVAICWVREGQGDPGDRYQITLTGPDGVTLHDETTRFSGPPQGLTCTSHRLDLKPGSPTGEYVLGVTLFSGEQVLGTYRQAQGILGLPSPGREPFLAMGSSCYVPSDSDLELLGYNVLAGEGFVWVDLFWRSMTTHQREYARAVDLTDPLTGQRLARSEAHLQKYGWEEGERYQERLLLWLDQDLPDGAQLSIELNGKLMDGCRADLLVAEYADTLPPAQKVYVSPVSPEDPSGIDLSRIHLDLTGYDGRSCLVVPAQATVDTAYIIVPEADPNSLSLLSRYFPLGAIAAEGPLHEEQPSFVVYEVPAGSTAEITPSQRTDVNWGNKIKLLGYDLDATAYVQGDSVLLTLYYETLEDMDANYTLFAHLVSSDESESAKPIWGQDDSEPCRRSYRTSDWLPGEIIRDEIVVPIASDAPPGDYQLEVGFYLWETMTRLPAAGAAGVSFRDDAVPLGSLSVRSVD